MKTELAKLIDKWEIEKGSYIPNAPIYQAFIDEAKEALERESKVNNVVSDDVKVELPIKKVEVNFNGDLLAEIEIQNNTLKVLRAVNGGGYMVDCKKVSIKEK